MPGNFQSWVLDEANNAWRPQSYNPSVSVVGTVTISGGVTATAVSLFKSVLTELRPISLVVAGGIDWSSILDATDYESVTLFIDHGIVSTSAPVAGTEYRIEASEKAAGADTWRQVVAFRTGTAAAVSGTPAAAPAGSTTVSLATTPAYTNTDQVFFFNASLSNSEWGRVMSVVANTSIAFEDVLTATQVSSPMYNRSEHFVAELDASALRRIRVLCNNLLHSNSYTLAWRVAAIASYKH